MKSARTLKAAGLVLIAVVLGMLTVQGSYALWNKSVSSNAGTVQAADFRISLTDTDANKVIDMTLPSGAAAALSLTTTAAGAVMPGQSIYAGVSVGNVTDAGGDFTVRASTAAPIVSNSAFEGHLTISSAAATSLSQCSDASLYADAKSYETAIVDIAKDATGVFCFQLTLSASMPASLSGQTTTVAIPITVNQL